MTEKKVSHSVVEESPVTGFALALTSFPNVKPGLQCAKVGVARAVFSGEVVPPHR